MFTGNLFLYNSLVMATLIVSIKFNDDVFFNNEFYSKVAGISCLEINNLEKEFLKMIDFNIHIEDEEFEKYKDRVEEIYRKELLNNDDLY